MEGMEAGLIGCNESAITGPDLPIGGVKQSSIGIEGGKQGIEEFLNIKLGVTSLV